MSAVDVAPSDAGRRIEHRGPIARDFAIFCNHAKKTMDLTRMLLLPIARLRRI